MADRLGSLGGNCRPASQIVISQTISADSSKDGILTDLTMLLNPPLAIPTNSTLNLQGVLQISTNVTLLEPWTLKFEVMPWLADVQANKVHMAPAATDIFPADTIQTPCMPTFGYNPTQGLVNGVYETQRQWLLGNIVPHSSNSRFAQLAGNPTNTLCDFRDSNVWMSLQTPSKSVHYQWPTIPVGSTTNATHLPFSPGKDDCWLVLAQPTYVPYPTATNLTAVSSREHLPMGFGCDTTYLNDYPDYIPFYSPGAPYASGPTGMGYTNNFATYCTWTSYDQSYGFQLTGRELCTFDMRMNYQRGSLVAGQTNICTNNVVPASWWAFKPLVEMGNEPKEETVLDMYYHDIFSSSPYCRPLQASSWIKAPYMQNTYNGSDAPGGYPPACNGGAVPTSYSWSSFAPMGMCSQRNTTMLDNPMCDEFHITQFGCIIPWNWGSQNYTTPDAAFPFHIRNDLSTFNLLTETEPSRQLSLNLSMLLKEFHSFSAGGRVNNVISSQETLNTPPAQINRKWNEAFVLRPGSFFVPFIGQNDRLYTTKCMERADLTGNNYDAGYLKNTIATQDPIIQSGNGEQAALRPNPIAEAFHDCSATITKLTNPTSLFRLPQVHYARPNHSVLLGQGQAFPYQDLTNPPIRNCTYQTYYMTITPTSGLFYESGNPAMGMCENALDATWVNQLSSHMSTIADMYWTVNTFSPNSQVEIVPFTWWGHLHDKINTYYNSQAKVIDEYVSYLPFMTQTMHETGQAGIVAKGQPTFQWNTVSTPWGTAPTFPMTTTYDLVCAPVAKGVPHQATMMPLFWFNPTGKDSLTSANIWASTYTASNYRNIGFTSAGSNGSLSASGEMETAEMPNAGRYHVAGRSIVLGDRAYGMLFNDETLGYHIPFKVTASITIPAGSYSYQTIANMITEAFNDPSSSIMTLTCNILDDDGNDTPIPGCLNAIGFDPIRHDVLWTNASSKSDSASLPLPLSVAAMVKMVSPEARILSDMSNQQIISLLMPTEWSSKGSRAVTAFRSSQAVNLQSNMSLLWMDGNFSLTGCSYPLYPPGGSGQGISDTSIPVASYSSGFYTRSPSCLQSVGIVTGITSGTNANVSNSACFGSDAYFLANCYPFAYDIVLTDGAYGPIHPTKSMTGSCDWAALTISAFSANERSNFSGCSSTMAGSLLPCNIGGSPYWGPGTLQTFLRLGNDIWSSSFTGPSAYMHKSPIINPIRSCVCAGLTGNRITRISGVSDSDKTLLGKIFGLFTEFKQEPSLFYVTFQEGLRTAYDTEKKVLREFYHPDNFCYMSPHPIDSDIFTKGPDVPYQWDYSNSQSGGETEVLLYGKLIPQTSFTPNGGSLGYFSNSAGTPYYRGYAWHGDLPNASSYGDVSSACPNYATLQGYRPFTCSNRFLSLSNIGEIFDKDLFTIGPGFAENNTYYFNCHRPEPSFKNVWNLDTESRDQYRPSYNQPGLISVEHALAADMIRCMGYKYAIDVVSMPAYHPISSVMPYLPGAMNDLYNDGDIGITDNQRIDYMPTGSLGAVCLSASKGFTRPFTKVDTSSTYVPAYLQTFNALIAHDWDGDPNLSSSFPVLPQAANPTYSSADSDYYGSAVDSLQYQAITRWSTMAGRNQVGAYLHKTQPIPPLNTWNLGYLGSPYTNVSPIRGDICFRYAHPLLPVAAFSTLTRIGAASISPNNAEIGSSLVVLNNICRNGPRTIPDQNGSSWMYQSGFTGGLNSSCVMQGMQRTPLCPIPNTNGFYTGTLGACMSFMYHGLQNQFDQDILSAVCNSNVSNFETHSRSYYSKLPRNCSQGPCADADGMWFFNTFSPEYYVSYGPIPGQLTGACIAPPSHPVYDTPHSNFTYHAYRNMMFGSLQQGAVPDIIEQDAYLPPCRATLLWLGYTKAFLNQNNTWTTSQWDGNASLPTSNSDSTGFHSTCNDLDGYNLAPDGTVIDAGVPVRFFFPLSLFPNKHYGSQQLTPIKVNYYSFTLDPATTSVTPLQTHAPATQFSFPLRTCAGVYAFNQYRSIPGDPANVPFVKGNGEPTGRDAGGNPWTLCNGSYCPPLQLTTPGYVSPFLFYNNSTDEAGIIPDSYIASIQIASQPTYPPYPAKTPPNLSVGYVSSQLPDPAKNTNTTPKLLSWCSAAEKRSLVVSMGYYSMSAIQRLNSNYYQFNPNSIPYPPVSLGDIYNGAQGQNTFIGGNTVRCAPTDGNQWDLNPPTAAGEDYEGSTSTSYFSGVFVPEPVPISFVYPQPTTLPWTEYYMQTPTKSSSLTDIQMSFEPLDIHAHPLVAFAKTPWISMTIGPAHYNSTTYASLGMYGTTSTAIAKALKYLPVKSIGPPSAKGFVSEKPPYKDPFTWTAEDFFERHRYLNRYRIARRIAFVDSMPDDPVRFTVPKIPKPYQADSTYSGPSINYNDNQPTDINPTIYPNPQFAPYNFPPTTGLTYGDILFVSVKTEPPMFGLRCDVRLNRENGDVSDRFLTKQIVIPQSNPQEVQQLATFSYNITLPPPLETAELVSVTLSLTDRSGHPVVGLFAHNASLAITPSVSAGDLVGYGISGGEQTNTSIPRLSYS